MSAPGRIAASVGLIAGITLVYFHLLQVNATTAALTWLLAVLLLATKWGFREAAVASVVATLCLDYFFLPPVGSFSLAYVQDGVALSAFLITSMAGNQLSSYARRQTAEARAQRHEMECLYELSRNLMLAGDSRGLSPEIAAAVVRAFHLEGSAFFDRGASKVYRAGTAETPVTDQELSDAALQGTVKRDQSGTLTVLPVGLGGSVVGSLAIFGGKVSETATQSMGNLVALALEREFARESAAHAKAAQSSAQLKSTIIDAVAHEFKTPLTSILTAAHTMRQPELDAATREDLVDVVTEEAGRLNALVTEAIQVARVETGNMKLDRGRIPVADLIETVPRQLRSLLDGRVVTIDSARDVADVEADGDLIALVLRQLLENAAKYTPSGTPIEIQAVNEHALVLIRVTDHGPGVPEPDRKRIFERFYRGVQSESSVPGIGMGLSVAREIVQAHGGRLWEENVPGGGACFTFSLRRARAAVDSSVAP